MIQGFLNSPSTMQTCMVTKIDVPALNFILDHKWEASVLFYIDNIGGGINRGCPYDPQALSLRLCCIVANLTVTVCVASHVLHLFIHLLHHIHKCVTVLYTNWTRSRSFSKAPQRTLPDQDRHSPQSYHQRPTVFIVLRHCKKSARIYEVLPRLHPTLRRNHTSAPFFVRAGETALNGNLCCQTACVSMSVFFTS